MGFRSQQVNSFRRYILLCQAVLKKIVYLVHAFECPSFTLLNEVVDIFIFLFKRSSRELQHPCNFFLERFLQKHLRLKLHLQFEPSECNAWIHLLSCTRIDVFFLYESEFSQNLIHTRLSGKKMTPSFIFIPIIHIRHFPARFIVL